MTDEENKVLDTILSLCQREGISPFQIDYKVHNEIKVSNVKGVITTDIKENVVSVRYRGMYEERLGTFEDDKLDENRVDEIIKFIKQSALNSDRLCRPEFFGEPGQRYKSSGFKLSNVKIDNLKILNNKIVQSLKGMNSLFNDDAINEISTTLITGRRMMVNSKGLKVEKKFDRIVMKADCTFTKPDGEKSSATETYIGYNLMTIKPEYLANRIDKEIMSSFKVGLAEKGKYKVAFSPRSAATILHIADLHLSGAMVASGKSVYKDQFGKDAFSPLLTVLNDPIISSVQSTPFDTEGNATEKFMAIDHGRLRCFFLDTEYGEILNIRSNSCATYGIPESQYFVVAPSADNTSLGLIRSVDNGYIVEGFDKDCVEKIKRDAEINLEIPFYGYEIKEGKIGKPVRGTIKGKADEFLRDVIGLSSEREDCSIEAALCPWFLIDNVEVE